MLLSGDVNLEIAERLMDHVNKNTQSLSKLNYPEFLKGQDKKADVLEKKNRKTGK